MKPSQLFFQNTLVPCIVQHALTGQVLMLAYMNEDSYQLTLETKKLHFYSRKRKQLWLKGETSGHFLNMLSLRHDCDNDTFLAEVLPEGPTCHTGSISCFDNGLISGTSYQGNVLTQLMLKLKERMLTEDSHSYTQYLMTSGTDKILKKVAEEAGEVIIAAKNDDPINLVDEMADLIYHIWILMLNKEIEIELLYKKIHERLQKTGNLKK